MGLLQDSYISYVNLEHRKDRLQHIQEQLKRVDIVAERTPGVYPHERVEEKSRMAAMLKRKQVGALGCYLAQVDIMKKALQLNKHAFILEDDVVFCSDFNERINYIDNWIKSDSGYDFLGQPVVGDKQWDILWLGGTFHVGGNGPYWHTNSIGRDAECTDDPRIIRTYGSFCTYAYIVNKDSIEKVLSLLDEFLPNSIGIDHSMINISPKLYTYAFVPGCCKQIDNVSDQHEGAYTTFSRFEKLNGTLENSAYWYQEYMNDFDPLSFDWGEAKIK